MRTFLGFFCFTLIICISVLGKTTSLCNMKRFLGTQFVNTKKKYCYIFSSKLPSPSNTAFAFLFFAFFGHTCYTGWYSGLKDSKYINQSQKRKDGFIFLRQICASVKTIPNLKFSNKLSYKITNSFFCFVFLKQKTIVVTAYCNLILKHKYFDNYNQMTAINVALRM